jgi:hypothetical protein
MSRMGKMGKLSDFGQSPSTPIPPAEKTIITPVAVVESVPTPIAVELPTDKPPGASQQTEIMVNVNIKMSQSQQEWLAAKAKMVRRNNSLPVPAKDRVYPQHLISLAVELLQSANVDWEEVKTIADLRERLALLGSAEGLARQDSSSNKSSIVGLM